MHFNEIKMIRLTKTSEFTNVKMRTTNGKTVNVDYVFMHFTNKLIVGKYIFIFLLTIC